MPRKGVYAVPVGNVPPRLVTVYASADDAHTSNNTWEDINAMLVKAVAVESNSKLLCEFTFRIKFTTSNWEHFYIRFDLDGVSQSEQWQWTRDWNATVNSFSILTYHTVFENVSVGTHTIKAQWSTASDMDVTFSSRRLTVTVW